MDGKNYKNRGEYVFETLKKEMLDLELKPGQPISENEICARFDVSRTPVREAFRRLQEQGFVHTVPYSGTYVTRLNLENIRHMIYMRVAVELMVMRDFMKEATPFQLEEIHHQIRLQELLIRSSFTGWTLRCTESGSLPQARRSFGTLFRNSSFTIPDSACWISLQRPILDGLSRSIPSYFFFWSRGWKSSWRRC